MHQYIGIEVLTMTAAMRGTLVEALKHIGRQDGDQPCKITHWRTRLDNLAIILEAEWAEDEVTVAALAHRLEALYGLAAGTVTTTTTQSAYGPLVVFKTGTTSRLRLVVFGGVEASWGESLAKATLYLKDNAATWEPAVA